jgi:hypothetical protein
MSSSSIFLDANAWEQPRFKVLETPAQREMLAGKTNLNGDSALQIKPVEAMLMRTVSRKLLCGIVSPVVL